MFFSGIGVEVPAGWENSQLFRKSEMTGSPESCPDSGKNQVEKVFGQMKCVTDTKVACTHLYSEK